MHFLFNLFVDASSAAVSDTLLCPLMLQMYRAVKTKNLNDEGS
jgi:hypothetical protein